MDLIHDSGVLRSRVREARSQRVRVGLVPTMGALHAGHLSLVRAARESCDFVVLSIYVNPTQFSANDDLIDYPRPLDADVEACLEAGVDVVFVPTSLYTDIHSTTVAESALSTGLCGASRPGHFDGVLTIVAKLFNIVQPDVAVFGEKDAQQLAVIRRMVVDLDFAVTIVSSSIVRDDDGLALSSRNTYLSSSERLRALSLSRALDCARLAFETGTVEACQLVKLAVAELSLADGDELIYAECVDVVDLSLVSIISRPALLLLAVHIGSTRLIDNCRLGD